MSADKSKKCGPSTSRFQANSLHAQSMCWNWSTVVVKEDIRRSMLSLSSLRTTSMDWKSENQESTGWWHVIIHSFGFLGELKEVLFSADPSKGMESLKVCGRKYWKVFFSADPRKRIKSLKTFPILLKDCSTCGLKLSWSHLHIVLFIAAHNPHIFLVHISMSKSVARLIGSDVHVSSVPGHVDWNSKLFFPCLMPFCCASRIV